MGVREKLLPGCPLSPRLQEGRQEARGAPEHRSQSGRQRGGRCSQETPSQTCPMAAPLSVPGTPGVSTLLPGAQILGEIQNFSICCSSDSRRRAEQHPGTAEHTRGQLNPELGEERNNTGTKLGEHCPHSLWPTPGAPKTSSPQTHAPQGSQHQPQKELGVLPQG